MQGVLAVSGKAGFSLAVGWGLEADFDVRVPFRQLLQNAVNFLFLVEDEVGKFFFPMQAGLSSGWHSLIRQKARSI